MMNRIMSSCVTTRQRTKRVPLEAMKLDGGGVATGFTTVADGLEQIEYEVYLDGDELNGMARKAARSKGRQSVDGPIKVVVISKKRI